MDPLRVSKAEDGYTIVSGHRRFAALSLLAKEDSRFSKAACIVDPGTESPQMQELRLIYANADTRRMSSADIARQAERVQELMLRGRSDISFIIGGSLGLSPAVLKRADRKLSFSRMTFPHQLMRVILLEQVYRAFKINAHEPYHK